MGRVELRAVLIDADEGFLRISGIFLVLQAANEIVEQLPGVKPVMLTYKGQEMIFCCKDCVKDFNQDPEKWIKKLEASQKKEASKSDTK